MAENALITFSIGFHPRLMHGELTDLHYTSIQLLLRDGKEEEELGTGGRKVKDKRRKEGDGLCHQSYL